MHPSDGRVSASDVVHRGQTSCSAIVERRSEEKNNWLINMRSGIQCAGISALGGSVGEGGSESQFISMEERGQTMYALFLRQRHSQLSFGRRNYEGRPFYGTPIVGAGSGYKFLSAVPLSAEIFAATRRYVYTATPA